MSIAAMMSRVVELEQKLAPTPPATVRTVAGAAPSAFAGSLLNATSLSAGAAVVGAGTPLSAISAAGTSAGQAMVRLAQAEVGQSEQPPGSNDSPRISQYRQATAGAGVGPWCSYFTSYLARESGVPVGDQGQGFGSVDALYSWAQGAGKAIPAGSGPPQPGDLIVWDEHVGIVEGVGADGTVQTIEGNSSDKVSRRTHAADGDGAVGYVRLG